MKMLSMLDMSGNQIQNFLVHNGNVNGTGALTAQTGRLVYDQTERSLYFGYQVAGSSNLAWARLVDEAHIGTYITKYAIPSSHEVVDVTTNYLAGRVELAFETSQGNYQYFAYIKEATSEQCGLMSPNTYNQISAIPNIESELQGLSRTVYDGVSNWNSAYSWGNHANAGYAKAYKVETAIDVEDNDASAGGSSQVAQIVYDNLTKLNQAVPGKTWSQVELVFDTKTNALLCRCSYPNATQKFYIKSWVASGGIQQSASIHQEGNLLFVKGNASVYKYESNAWVLYFSGASQDVIEKIDDIRDALGLDNDTTPDVIDTWNEIKEYFANIDNDDSKEEILALIASKADADKVIEKPAADGAEGDILTISHGATSDLKPNWKKHKIVAQSEDAYGDSLIVNHSWEIDITSLETQCVTVCLYRQNADTSWEMILADVKISANAGVTKCTITFGDEGSSLYQAVITA